VTILIIVRRLVALAIFVYIVVTFRKEAKRHGGTPWKWSSLGVLTFYGSFALVSLVAIALLVGVFVASGSGLSATDREMIPKFLPVVLVAGLGSAFIASKVVLHRLVSRARTRAAILTAERTAEPSLPSGDQPEAP
jgi:hypothetical protein